jgi:hypothetical protein
VSDDLNIKEDKWRGILMLLLKDFFRDFSKAIIRGVVGFGIGTGVGGIVCWYYGIPLIFSLLGGILVLGFALALVSNSSFFDK